MFAKSTIDHRCDAMMSLLIFTDVDIHARIDRLKEINVPLGFLLVWLQPGCGGRLYAKIISR